MKIAVILPAAGVGSRFAGDTSGGTPWEPILNAGAGPESARSKIELPLAGKPVFLHAVDLFLGRPEVVQIVIAVRPAGLEEFRLRWSDKLGFHGVTIVAGGTRERWETVRLAVEAVLADCTHIAIHDAARPLTSAGLIDRVFAAARQHPAIIPALPVSSTLKRVRPEAARVAPPADGIDAILDDEAPPIAVRRVVETVDRSNLVEAQTPQVFDAALLRRAVARLADDGVDAAQITDDAALIEALGEPVVTVEGESTNLKITRPADAEIAAALLNHRAGGIAREIARKRLFNDEDDEF